MDVGGREEQNRHILYFCDIDVKVCHTGTPLWKSNTFPNSGNPFGPGGNNGLGPLLLHFQTNARETAAHSDAK